MSTVLADEELMKTGFLYGFSDNDEDEEEEDFDGGTDADPANLDDEDLLAGAGLDDEVFGEDEDDEEDPFSPKEGSDDEEDE